MTSKNAETILIIEDNVSLRDMTREYFEVHGFLVQVASNGQEGLVAMQHSRPDLIVLDVMMPGMNGLEFLTIFRTTHQIPVILLTARDAEADKIHGLELGADDYVTKPFSLAELLARARAHLRRQTQPVAVTWLQCGAFDLDVLARTLRVQGRPVDLTRSEFDLIHLLMRHPYRVFSRLELLEGLREEAQGVERTIDVHIRNLRVKIEEQPRQPRWLETVYGVGYRFSPDREA
ncbi:response regulator transcription factor [Deinococcus ruber]|uniref:DNA-binding response regulator n=1 Tax=Deinococcus ruber TaxID=1848197 RepID=A0A918CH21_9DEIO|nr:response regulator transcription factor [Deinococcus ruber]GGR23265.1 DNA-binding response regulator [Deinococcus ruber]